MSESTTHNDWSMRRHVVFGLFVLVSLALVGRAGYLQILNEEFLSENAEQSQQRTVTVPAHRGMILDRNGEPLAVSTPVSTITVVPRRLLAMPESQVKLKQLAKALGMKEEALLNKLERNQHRGNYYLKRHVSPQVSETVKAMKLPGVGRETEYLRYYPDGEVIGHLLGFTNIDDKGQEGLELAFDDYLRGQPGQRRQVMDGKGNFFADLEEVKPVLKGQNLYLSIDKRIQYLAYRELKSTVLKHKARSGSIVVMDAKTGEVLALANQPTFNPNNRSTRKPHLVRNRAVLDALEPGSTMKSFSLIAAMDSGKYQPGSAVYTAPGYYRIGRFEIKDSRNYGTLNLTGVIKKSSNIGAGKIGVSLEPEKLWEVYDQFGFGNASGSSYPGESYGQLPHFLEWNKVGQFALSYGYGMAVTPLQLARAYNAIAAGGVMRDASFLRQDEVPEGTRVMDPQIVSSMQKMLATVPKKGGTGTKARVKGYTVAGKTGTTRKAQKTGGYSEEHYVASFSGFAPLSDPRFTVVVVINDPQAGKYYGGDVAAPAFSRVMAGALRYSGVMPDGELDQLTANILRRPTEEPS